MFRNREEAARLLAQRLKGRELRDPLVLAIPRGGVVTGAVLARELGAELDVVLARKLRAPDYPNLAVGAIAEYGPVYLTQHAHEVFDLTELYLATERQHQLDQIAWRKDLYRSALTPGIDQEPVGDRHGRRHRQRLVHDRRPGCDPSAGAARAHRRRARHTPGSDPGSLPTLRRVHLPADPDRIPGRQPVLPGIPGGRGRRGGATAPREPDGRPGAEDVVGRSRGVLLRGQEGGSDHPPPAAAWGRSGMIVSPGDARCSTQ